MERNELMMMMMMMQSSNSAAAAVVSRSLSSASSSISSNAASASAALNNSSPYQQAADDGLFDRLAEELTLSRDRKSETERALMEELLTSLRKEEKLLEADAWKYAAPRSQLQLTSMLGMKLAKGNSSAGTKQMKAEKQPIR